MGLVHPKIKIVSSFYSTFVPNQIKYLQDIKNLD